MAKRKRLEVPAEPVSSDLETKRAVATRARMPIADVAGDTAGRAALEEVAREMTIAEREGRIVKKIPLDQVAVHHLSRDRMELDESEMEALTASIAERGQQTPIEVVRLAGDPQYGLISGMRRIEALRRIGVADVLALVKAPEGSQDAYQAMVEENEIRAGLSFFERANIAVAAVGQGVYPDVRAAVKGLFSHAPKARRSKITKFVTVCNALGATLRFPAAIPEHLGLALAQSIEADRKQAGRIVAALLEASPDDATAERKVLEQALARRTGSVSPSREEIGAGVTLDARAGRAVLAGKAVDQDFIQALKVWVADQTKA